jgi:ribulose-phosphate 3-epimerase
MLIIPALNCTDKESLVIRLNQADEIYLNYPDAEPWIHIDVADGSFTKGYSTWRNPDDLKIISRNPSFKIEIHLMANNPESIIEPWLRAKINRLIFHLESAANVEVISDMAKAHNIEPMLAITPTTSAQHMLPYLNSFSFCQILAVNPGLSGQDFQMESLEKIKIIKEKFPQIIVEVDGGINDKTSKLCRSAGADQIVASSFIFENEDPIKAYKSLNTI